MNQPDSHDRPSVTLSMDERLDDVCDRFEAALQLGQKPRIEDYLSPSDTDEHDLVFRELLAIEIEHRGRGGESPSASEYLERFPDYREGIEELVGSAKPTKRVDSTRTTADQNLLFGILALQTGAVERDQFVEACAVWAAQKDSSLASIMLDREWISREQSSDIERLLAGKLERYRGDAKASVSAVARGETIDLLASIDNEAIRECMPSKGASSSSSDAATSERYTLNHLHATGGLGRVWLARDSRVGRDVALKELRPDRLGSSRLDQRFVSEACITGQLEHPNIVPVYEVEPGADATKPFYTMRFVKGQTLKEAIDAFHQERQTHESRSRELYELLQALVSVSNAIAYAHSRRIIHRDLKGSNVVLGDFGEVIVLDWGLAKKIEGEEPATDETVDLNSSVNFAPSETREGQLVGTPAYMSPEQATGRQDQVDERSDVYGLAAILYEILTGRPPFIGTETADILRQVQHANPTRPREVWSGAAPALEAICLKGLSKESSDRYASAREFGDDLQRWLADEPVNAYVEPITAQAARWARRHRTAVAGVVVLLVTAVVGLAVNSFLLNREKNRTTVALERAQRNFGRARQAVDQMLTRVGDEQLKDMPHMEALRRELLEDAIVFLRQFADEESDDPEVIRETASTYERLGKMSLLLGQPTDAEKEYESAIGHWQELVDDQGLDVDRRGLATAYRGLFDARENMSKLDTAEEALEKAIDISKQLKSRLPSDEVEHAEDFYRLGRLDDARKKAEEAIAKFNKSISMLGKVDEEVRTSPRNRMLLAEVFSALGLVLGDEGQVKESEAAYRKALALQEQVVAEQPKSAMARSEVASTHTQLGVLMMSDPQRQKEAINAFQNSYATRLELSKDYPEIPDYLLSASIALQGLAIQAARAEEVERSLELFTEIVDIRKKLVDSYPAILEYRAALATAHRNLGVRYSNSRRYEEALGPYMECMRIREKTAAENPNMPRAQEQLADSLSVLTGTLHGLNRLEECVEYTRRSIKIYESLPNPNPQDRHRLAQVYRRLADICHDLDRSDEAEDAIKEAIRISKAVVAEVPLVEHRRHYALHFVQEAEIYGNTRRNAEALKSLATALESQAEIREEFPGRVEYAEELARTHREIARIHGRLGDIKLADEELSKSSAVYQDLIDAGGTIQQRRELSKNHVQHSELLADSDAKRAESLAQAAIDLMDGIVERADEVSTYVRDVAVAHAALGRAQHLNGSDEDSATSLATALTLYKQFLDDQPLMVQYKSEQADALHQLGELRFAAGEKTEALKLLRQAVDAQHESLEAFPDRPHRLAMLRDHSSVLSGWLLMDGDYNEVIEIANRLGRVQSSSFEEARQAAVLAVKAHDSVGADESLSDDDRQSLQETARTDAIKHLRAALDLGLPREELGADEELASLRSAAEFKKLVDGQ